MAADRGQATGFRTADGKLALMTGRIELAAPLPETPATVAVEPPGGPFTFPALRADEAFAYLRAHGSPANAPGARPAPVRVTSITLGSAIFSTDRGPLRLPAWLFGAPDLTGELAWPAVDKTAFWRYGEPNDVATISPAQLSRDGRQIRWAVPGNGTCPSNPVRRYWVEVVETRTTVAVTTVSEIVSTPGPEDREQPCVLMAQPAEPYDVELAAPLGNRIVIGHIDDAPAPDTEVSPTP
ncbi:hypothetical protein [Asanoa iriomotensis]|uniref:hypothetical protein n=1 Tax=Asanoa iriomotensis TaxID=234613 RepID=UPI0019426984|nr:hypothetical protein [Asanoa iriomotensis]